MYLEHIDRCNALIVCSETDGRTRKFITSVRDAIEELPMYYPTAKQAWWIGHLYENQFGQTELLGFHRVRSRLSVRIPVLPDGRRARWKPDIGTYYE